MAFAAISITGCDGYLDRQQKADMDDNNFWTNEANLRLFVNGFYPNYFVGYNSGWGTGYSPLRGYYFSDDFTSSNKQTNFSTSTPADNWYRNESSYASTIQPYFSVEYGGSPWNFAWVRKANTMLNRLDKMKANGYLTDEAYKHWTAVAHFFRGVEYCRLVESFGDVPYYDHVVEDDNFDDQYKDRDPRTTVMDGVYADFEYALSNMRANDGANMLNKYIAAGFVTRYMLFEGTWYVYHKTGEDARAKKYLEMVVSAGDLVMSSGKYSFDTDFRSLFGSEDLSKMKEVLMYRSYSADQSVTHHVASYSNLTESQSPAANLSLIKSFICNDGKVYQNSSVANATKFDHKNLAVTRDPRFEATFWDEPNAASSTLLYADKFIDRIGPTYYGKTYPAKYGSSTNTNGYPVMRLAEVVLDWIEAKAVLATNLGGAAVTQADIDKSINAIRNRPLDATAIAKGVKKTAPLQLSAIPDDPSRDSDVPALIWEIRRERRMEFVFEHTRLHDIKRWAKINYMDGSKNPDLLKGIWVDFNNTQEGKITTSFDYLKASMVNKLKVEKADGTIVTYNGSNAADMVGFYIPQNVANRDAFTDRVYLAPICTDVINLYKDKGYKITQNPGWNE